MIAARHHALCALLALPLLFIPVRAQDGEDFAGPIEGEDAPAATTEQADRAFDAAVADLARAEPPARPRGEAERLRAQMEELHTKYDGVKAKLIDVQGHLAQLWAKYHTAVAGNAAEDYVREIKRDIAGAEEAEAMYQKSMDAIRHEIAELNRRIAALPAPAP